MDPKLNCRIHRESVCGPYINQTKPAQTLTPFLSDYHFVSRDSSVGIATGYGLDDQGEREFESR
jgi:hypothetical protein